MNNGVSCPFPNKGAETISSLPNICSHTNEPHTSDVNSSICPLCKLPKIVEVGQVYQMGETYVYSQQDKKDQAVPANWLILCLVKIQTTWHAQAILLDRNELNNTHYGRSNYLVVPITSLFGYQSNLYPVSELLLHPNQLIRDWVRLAM